MNPVKKSAGLYCRARQFALATTTLSTLLAIALVMSACQAGHTPQVESIVLGDLGVDSSVFVYIAEDQHFFEANGLAVNSKNYDTGPAAMEALLKRQVDIAAMGELPVVTNALAKKEIKVIGTTDKFEAFYLVCRKDRGVERVSDLKGKTVGLVKGALPEFYLGRLLTLNGMNFSDVNQVNVSPAQWVNAIAGGEFDAVVVSQTYLSRIRQRMGNGIMILPAQSDQAAFGLLIGNDGFIGQHPETVKRFLQALTQAEQYFNQHPEQAKALLKRRFGYDDAYIAELWPNHQFSITLDQSLIAAMEDEARWMIANDLTTEKQVPNFLDYIYMDGLETIKPDAVNIIH